MKAMAGLRLIHGGFQFGFLNNNSLFRIGYVGKA